LMSDPSPSSPGNGNGAPPTDVFHKNPSDISIADNDTTIITNQLDPTLDFVAGTAAGVSGLVVGFPFDTCE
jgi:hypothetical protein